MQALHLGSIVRVLHFLVTTGTQTTEGTGRKSQDLLGDTMNTLHQEANRESSSTDDAQIAMTTYRGVKFECKQGVDEVHGTFCYRGQTYNK